MLAAAVLAVSVPAVGEGQAVEGRVLDEEDERPVPTALVRLVDESGADVAVTTADSAGRYRVEAEDPGVYRLLAERIGYETMETPLLEMERTDGTYPVDLLLRPAPIPIEGLQVTDRELDRRMRLVVGRSPRTLRWGMIGRQELLNHVERTHDLTDLMRWGNHPGIEVLETDDGPCYQVRRYGCLPAYLDGFPLTRKTFDLVPLDMLHTVVLVAPNESVTYPGGAVLMFTEAWLR